MIVAGAPERAGRRRFVRAAAMLLLAGSLGACSVFNGLGGLFDSKDDTPPDEAADRLYNEGLYLLNVSKNRRKRPRNSRKWTASIPIRNGRANP